MAIRSLRLSTLVQMPHVLVMLLCITASCCTPDASARLRIKLERRARARSRSPGLGMLVPDLPSLTNKVHQPLPTSPDNISVQAWAPLKIDGTCSDGMSWSWAPCIKESVNKAAQASGSSTHITLAEELIYPDFKVRIPVFGNEADKAYWIGKVSSEFPRACLHGDFASYKGQQGQNLVFSNATYNGLPAMDSWDSNSCMNPDVSHWTFGTQPPSEDLGAGLDLPSVSIVASPDSWSFQHFHDRVTHIILQGQHLTHPDTVYLTGLEPVDDAVKALWQRLVPNAKSHVMHSSEGSWPIRARELIFSCRAPLMHPWFAQRLAEEVGVAKWQKPLSERLVVMYCSRAQGKGGPMRNGGRSFTNDDAVITALDTLLAIRGEDERLEVFNVTQWEEDFDGMVRYFASNVRAIIGPHGGALVNLNWAPRDTAVIEVMPSDFFSLALYEHASVLGQTYAFLQSPSVGPANDMTVDIPIFMGLIDSTISKAHEGGGLQASYEWNTDARRS